MKNFQFMNQFSLFPLRTAPLVSAVAASLALVACGGGGGGGGGDAPPEARVTSVAQDASVLEGSSNLSVESFLIFNVTLDKPVVNRLELRVTTVSAIKPGFDSTPGAAKGGIACLSTVDYITLNDTPVVFLPGQSSGQIVVRVCQDADFEPNEVLYVSWKPVGGSASTLNGTIINDDAGGLNSTGATALLGGVAAFGRDVHVLTNGGSDGALGFSFVASGDCVVDKVTGLTWQKSWSGAAVDHASNAVRDLVVSANSGSGLCEKTDWRLPRVNELLSLMDFSVTSGSSVNADFGFSSDMGGDFWSQEIVASATTQAWVVSPAQGGAVSPKTRTDTNTFVRLVSGGLENGIARAATCGDAADRFTVLKSTPIGESDGTVYDTKSGLMWKQCREGLFGAQCDQTTPTSFISSVADETYLSNWLRDVNNKPDTLGAGFSDWRVPTVKELASLVDRCLVSGAAINGTIFPNPQAFSYVSSNNDANNPSQFWYVDFNQGTIAVPTTTSGNDKYLRLVRAGQ
jgi:hypothetical protein